MKVSGTESLKNLKEPTNCLDALTSLDCKEIGHPKAMGWNESINMEVRWHREGTAHTRSQRVQCLQAFGELNKWKEIHAPQSRITSLGVDCIFMYNIFKDRKLRLQEGKKKKIKKHNTAFRRTEEVPNTSMNTEAPDQTAWPFLQQRKESASCPPFSTPTVRSLWLQPARKAPDLQLKFTESKWPRANGLWWTSLSTKEIFVCPQNTRQTQELQALANTLNLACQKRRVTRSPPLLQGMVRAEGGKAAVPSRGGRDSKRSVSPFCHPIAKGVQAWRALHRAQGHGIQPQFHIYSRHSRPQACNHWAAGHLTPV